MYGAWTTNTTITMPSASVRPLLDRQKTIDESRDRHADQTDSVDEQLHDRSTPAILDRSADELDGLHEGSFALCAGPADSLSNLQEFLDGHRSQTTLTLIS